MASTDWLDINGWVISLVEFSMDTVHDLLPFYQSEFASVQPMLETLISTSIICTIIFGLMMTTLLALTWIERKFIGRLMDRFGATTSLRSLWVGESGVTAGDWWNQLPLGIGAPIGWLNGILNSIAGNDHKLEAISRVNNRGYHGIWFLLPGLFQNVADFIKFASKEHIVPEKADKFVFEIAPVIILATTIMVFAFIPFGPHIWAANPELSLLFMMAIFGIAPLGVFFAGWSSNNKYTLIGGMRSAAQLTAYEIPLLITVLGVAVLSGSFNIIEIVDFQIQQSDTWNIFLLPLGGALFLITMIAEVERIPFDMPEAEAELVEGWWTEYGGMRWGLMFAAEYMRSYAACLLFALFFLGGWQFPFEDTLASLPTIGGAIATILSLVPGVVWLIAKAYVLFAGFVWVRASLHRVRTDQILEFGWRYLLPLSIVNLGVAIYLRLEVWTGESWPVWTAPALSLIALALFIIYAIDEDKDALAYSRRPYNIQASDKAYPGRHKE
jgi:NADH-quinone oxidoreductase subunit H